LKRRRKRFAGTNHSGTGLPPLSEMVKLPLVAKHLGPLLERHRDRSKFCASASKPATALFSSTSAIWISRATTSSFLFAAPGICLFRQRQCFRGAAKVSLGTNPWNQATANQNLASLAEKFGGGGHPRVSAISFEPGDLPRAREVARGLTATLRGK